MAQDRALINGSGDVQPARLAPVRWTIISIEPLNWSLDGEKVRAKATLADRTVYTAWVTPGQAAFWGDERWPKSITWSDHLSWPNRIVWLQSTIWSD